MSKELKEKYGIEMKPIAATRAYHRPIDHFKKTDNIDAWSWVLVNDNTNTVVYVNTYRGNAGRKWRPQVFDLNEDKLAKKIKKYSRIDVSDCPIAEIPTAAIA